MGEKPIRAITDQCRNVNYRQQAPVVQSESLFRAPRAKELQRL